jgi:hypothetical protein
MSHGPNRYRAERQNAERAAEAGTTEPRAATRAQRVIAVWNARARRGRPAEFFPTFQTALTAGCWRLAYCCPACQQMGSIDLRDFADAHHPQAPISMVIPKLSCDRCCPNPPLAVLLALESLSAELPVAVEAASIWEPVQPAQAANQDFDRSTMGDLARNEPGWLWLHCENADCGHKCAVAVVPFVIRWGENAPSDWLRRSMRCTKCGHKGALTYHPSWHDSNAGWQPFPTDGDGT